MFETTSEDNFDSKITPSLTPGIYRDFNLVSVKATKAEKKDGSEGKAILTFEFRGPNGEAHQHTEWDPTDSNDPKKTKNLVLRVGHIMSKFVPKERLIQSNKSWEAYTAWVVATLGTSYKEVKVDFKIIGNVWNDKATSGFPNYTTGFIVKSGEPISFSAGDLDKNREFAEFMEKKKAGSPNAAATQPEAPAEDVF